MGSDPVLAKDIWVSLVTINMTINKNPSKNQDFAFASGIVGERREDGAVNHSYIWAGALIPARSGRLAAVTM